MANRRGLRILSKIYQNLPPEIIRRQTIHLVKKESTAPTSLVPQAVHDKVDVFSRLERIEHLLGQLITQKRVKTVERDEDDLIVRVVDEPLSEDPNG